MTILPRLVSRESALLLLIAAFAGTDVAGQSIEQVAPGTRVRVTAPALGYHGVVALVLARDSRGLLVETVKERDTVGLAFEKITALEASYDRHGHAVAGLGIGVAGGVVAGVVAGYAAGDDKCPPCEGWECLACAKVSAGDKAKVNAIAFGAVGGLVGGIAGATIKGERWRAVLIPSRTITGFGGTTTGVGLKIGLRLEF